MRFSILNLLLLMVVCAQAVYIYQQSRKLSQYASTVPVVFPAHTVPAGVALKPEHMKIVFCSESSVPDGCYSEIEPLVGETPMLTLRASEPITSHHFEFLHVSMPRGYKVIAVKHNWNGVAADAFEPGDLVDVRTGNGALVTSKVEVFLSHAASANTLIVGLLVRESEGLALANSQKNGALKISPVPSLNKQ